MRNASVRNCHSPSHVQTMYTPLLWMAVVSTEPHGRSVQALMEQGGLRNIVRLCDSCYEKDKSIDPSDMCASALPVLGHRPQHGRSAATASVKSISRIRALPTHVRRLGAVGPQPEAPEGMFSGRHFLALASAMVRSAQHLLSGLTVPTRVTSVPPPDRQEDFHAVALFVGDRPGPPGPKPSSPLAALQVALEVTVSLGAVPRQLPPTHASC